MIRVLTAFAVAGLGVAVFRWLALPLPWLLGPIFACLIAALSRVPMGGVPVLNDGMRTILGVAVGATLTPAVLATFPEMWSTLVLVPVMVLLIGVIGVPYFQRLCGYDFPTAYYATMPGGLHHLPQSELVGYCNSYMRRGKRTDIWCSIVGILAPV